MTGYGADQAAYWPQFRGPNSSGVAHGSKLPVNFGPATNLIWEVSLPSGHSSPCIWGDKIFLTGYDAGKLETYCVNRGDGKIAWRRTAPAEIVEKVSGLGSPAASTPVTDGAYVYAYFGSFGPICYDFEGTQQWQKPLPTPITQHGTATSPIIAGNLLILSRDQDVGACLLAIDPKNGKTVWQTPRPGYRRGFSTPIIWRYDSTELVVLPGTLRVAAYNLADGAEEWVARGLPNEMCGTPVIGGGLLIVGGWTHGADVGRFPPFEVVLEQGDKDADGRIDREEAPAGPARQHFLYIDADKNGIITRQEYDTIADVFASSENALLAIRPGGNGDITQTHIAWKQTRGLPYVSSPLYYNNRVYLVKNGGLVSCFNATNGAVVYVEERLGALGDYYSSPIAADGKICVASRQGIVVIFSAGDALNILARNKLGEPIMATPAVVEDTLYVRTENHLYAFGER